MEQFERVIRALEGEETERSKAMHSSGRPLIVERRTFGPDRWIDRACVDGALQPDEFLAIVLFVLGRIGRVDADRWPVARQIVAEWSGTLTAAVEAGEVVPRDPITLLPLAHVPEGTQWVFTVSDADRLLRAQGMVFTCSEVASHLREECGDAQPRESWTWADTGEAAHIPTIEPPAAPLAAKAPKLARAGDGPRAPQVHRLHGSRRSVLDPTIDAICARVAGATDPAAAWNDFVDLADRRDPPAPLLGFADGQVSYRGAEGPMFIDRKAFVKRIKRRA